MLLNASCKIAVKCSRCGKYKIIDLNLFKLGTSNVVNCSCGQKMLSARVCNKALQLDIECIACEKSHTYRFKLKDVLEKPLNIISCPNTGMEIAFLGRDSYVENVVERYISDVYELMKYLGVIGEK